MKSVKKIFLVMFTVITAVFLTACSTSNGSVYQVSLLQALTLGEYDGVITVKELKKHGDTGLGTYNGINGEMIMLNGAVYQALGNGKVVMASEDETVPFANVGFFAKDIDLGAGKFADVNAFKNFLNRKVEKAGKNQFYILKAEGFMDKLIARSEEKQFKPYKTLEKALATAQREFKYTKIRGTIVALYFPPYMSGLNMSGWHFHFVSEDKTKGGHLFDFKNFDGTVVLSKKHGLKMDLPDRDSFNQKNLGKDQSANIKKIEQK